MPLGAFGRRSRNALDVDREALRDPTEHHGRAQGLLQRFGAAEPEIAPAQIVLAKPDEPVAAAPIEEVQVSQQVRPPRGHAGRAGSQTPLLPARSASRPTRGLPRGWACRARGPRSSRRRTSPAARDVRVRVGAARVTLADAAVAIEVGVHRPVLHDEPLLAPCVVHAEQPRHRSVPFDPVGGERMLLRVRRRRRAPGFEGVAEEVLAARCRGRPGPSREGPGTPLSRTPSQVHRVDVVQAPLRVHVGPHLLAEHRVVIEAARRGLQEEREAQVVEPESLPADCGRRASRPAGP